MPVNDASGSSERTMNAATRFAEAAKKSGIFKRSPDAIKSASRQSLPSGSNDNKKGFGVRQSTEAEREAKRARKAERNRRKANAAKRRG